jgi:hypothetical protein
MLFFNQFLNLPVRHFYFEEELRAVRTEAAASVAPAAIAGIVDQSFGYTELKQQELIYFTKGY